MAMMGFVMKVYNIIIIALMTILAVPVVAISQSGDERAQEVVYLPLAKGNQWKYEMVKTGPGVINSDSVTISEKVDKIYKNRVIVTGDHYTNNSQTRTVETEYELGEIGVFIIRKFVTEYGTPVMTAVDYLDRCMLIPDTQKINEQWTCESVMTIGKSTAKLFEEFEVEEILGVETEVGSISDCLKIRHLRILTRENEPIRKESWKFYCPEVGLVKEEYEDLRVDLKEINFEVQPSLETIMEDEVEAQEFRAPVNDSLETVELKSVDYGSLYVEKGTVPLILSTDPAVPIIGIIGWSAEGKYIAYTENTAPTGSIPERLTLYIVEVARGRVVSKSEKFIYEDMDVGGSGLERLAKLNGEIVKEFTYGLDKFGIKKTPGNILIMDKSALGPVGAGGGPGKHIAMALSPNGNGVFTLVPDAVAGWGDEKIVSWNFGSGVANEKPVVEPEKKPEKPKTAIQPAPKKEEKAPPPKAAQPEKEEPVAEKVMDKEAKFPSEVVLPKELEKQKIELSAAVEKTETKELLKVEETKAEKTEVVEPEEIEIQMPVQAPREVNNEAVKLDNVEDTPEPLAVVDESQVATGAIKIEIEREDETTVEEKVLEEEINYEAQEPEVEEKAEEEIEVVVNNETSVDFIEEPVVEEEVLEAPEPVEEVVEAATSEVMIDEELADIATETIEVSDEIDEESAGGVCPEGMAYIPQGKFLMGCSEGDEKCDMPEWPAHKVEISTGFCMDKYEVTQAQYEKAMESNPSLNVSCGGDCPVEMVSWEEAGAYCRVTGRRLPTEAEWEYAARGGTKTAYYWGASEGSMDDYVWSWRNAANTLHKVGKKKPNQYGLYDMLGGLWEWVQDCFSDAWYDRGGTKDPINNAPGCSYRVIRGGSRVNADPAYHRVSKRNPEPAESKTRYIGFRCVTDKPEEAVTDLIIDPRGEEGAEEKPEEALELTDGPTLEAAAAKAPPMPDKMGAGGMKCPSNTLYVPPGDYWIGCDGASCGANSKPRHRVSITKGYCADNYLVTQKKYDSSMGYLNYYGNMCGEACPAEMISWDEGLTYCEKTGKRLLTEAEWEVAAEKGLLRSASDSSSPLALSGGFVSTSSAEHDEAWEWVVDCYDENWYSKSPSEDPKNNASGCGIRTLRGGPLGEDQITYEDIRARKGSSSGTREENIGFRCGSTR